MTTMPVPKSRIVESEEQLGQELFLYDDASGAVHTLNDGAAMIWLLCDGTRDAEGISTEIASASGLAEQEVLAQVQETIAQFIILGLLED